MYADYLIVCQEMIYPACGMGLIGTWFAGDGVPSIRFETDISDAGYLKNRGFRSDLSVGFPFASRVYSTIKASNRWGDL